MYKQILLLLLFCALTPTIGSQGLPQSRVKEFAFSFRSGSDLLLKEYKNNYPQLSSLMDLLSTKSEFTIDSMVIVGSASPEGAAYLNKKLSMSRANSVRKYLAEKFYYINNIPIHIVPAPSSWQDVIEDIRQDPWTPHQEYVMDMLEFYGEDPMILALINEVHPDSYTYLCNNILPHRRNATACLIFYTEKTPATEPEPEPKPEPEVVPTVPKVETPEIAPKPEEPLPIQIAAQTYVRKPLFAIKTNLLFDAATLVNLELEIPIGKRVSIAGEIIAPWWLWEEKQHAIQVVSGNLEVRYWFGNRDKTRSGNDRKVMTGWFAGVYAGGGYYDLEWNKRGYQGEFFITAGISGGYAHPIGRNLRMEYSLGVGYLQTNYRHYEARMGADSEWYLYRQSDGKFSWFGPTRAKISLVWMLGTKQKQRGGGR